MAPQPTHSRACAIPGRQMQEAAAPRTWTASLESRLVEVERIVQNEVSRHDDQRRRLELLEINCAPNTPPPRRWPHSPQPPPPASEAALRPVCKPVALTQDAAQHQDRRKADKETSVPLEDSVWDASLLVGTIGLGRLSSAWAAMLLLATFVMQVCTCLTHAGAHALNLMSRRRSQSSSSGSLERKSSLRRL